MPYYITKESINKSILNIFSSAQLGLTDVNLISNDLLNFGYDALKNADLLNSIYNLKISDSALFDFADMLFQLKEYKFYLSYFIKVFLMAKQFDCLTKFFQRIFVNHIGDVHYASSEHKYDFAERYFDRFVESLIYCDIDIFLCLEYLFKIFFAESNEICSKFKLPAKEFLKNFILKNESGYLKYIFNEQKYKQGYIILLELLKEKGANKIIENLVTENYFDKNELLEVFLHNKELCLSELKNFIIKNKGERQTKALSFYLSFAKDVKGTLSEILNCVEDEGLKNIISDEIELSKTIVFETIAELVAFSEGNTPEFEEGLSTKYLTYFNNGNKLSDKTITYVFNLFKSVSSAAAIVKFGYLKKFFNLNELNNLGRNLLKSINHQITFENKWIVTFVCALCSEEVVSEIVKIAPNYLTNSELNSFILSCLVETNYPSVIELIKNLYVNSINKKIYLNFLDVIAKNNNLIAQDYLDEMVNNYGLDQNCERQFILNGEGVVVKIDDRLMVKILSRVTNKNIEIKSLKFEDEIEISELYNNLVLEVRNQIDNFKVAYETKRVWTVSTFVANILTSPILKKVASTIVFGVYDKDMLVKILTDISDVSTLPQDNKIAIINLSEVEGVTLPNKQFEPFRQINALTFRATDKNYSHVFDDTFFGAAVNEIKFNSKLRSLGYKMTSGEDSYYFKQFDFFNLLVKINIKKIAGSVIVINNIEFFNLSLVKAGINKIVIGNEKPEELGSINKRVYCDVLNDINESCYY